MSTSAIMIRKHRVQICSNCELCFEKSFKAGCDLNVWEITSKQEKFFYNPKDRFYSLSLISERNIDMWHNGIMCKDYEGPNFIITEISAHSNPSERQELMNGSSITINGNTLDYQIVFEKVGNSRSYRVDLSFERGNGGMFERWLRTITLQKGGEHDVKLKQGEVMSKTNRTAVGGLTKSKKAKGSKKGRKIGRNKVKCERYRLENRREKNKAKRAARKEARLERKLKKLCKEVDEFFLA